MTAWIEEEKADENHWMDAVGRLALLLHRKRMLSFIVRVLCSSLRAPVSPAIKNMLC